MTKWLFKIVISDITRNYNGDESKVNRVGEMVAERIKQSGAYQRFPKSFDVIIKKIKEADTEAKFNHALDELYDFGDAHAIWIENFPFP